MRTLILTLMFLVVIAPVAVAQDAAPEKKAAEVAAESAPVGPFGEVQLVDSTVVEILELQKFGSYYLYISGKLNGRSSTVISLTRLNDIRRWAGILFKDQNTFTIITKQKKELHFTDAHLYLGSNSPTDYIFLATDPNTYEKGVRTVKKIEVQGIRFK